MLLRLSKPLGKNEPRKILLSPKSSREGQAGNDNKVQEEISGPPLCRNDEKKSREKPKAHAPHQRGGQVPYLLAKDKYWKRGRATRNLENTTQSLIGSEKWH